MERLLLQKVNLGRRKVSSDEAIGPSCPKRRDRAPIIHCQKQSY